MPAGYLHINGEQVKIASGHVAPKKGRLYWVLNLPDAAGVCKPKWAATHLKEKGNKTRARDMLNDVWAEWAKKNYLELHSLEEKRDSNGSVTSGKKPEREVLMFYALLLEWLEYKYRVATQQFLGKKSLELITYAGYETNVKNSIGPYFLSPPIKVTELSKEDLEEFYTAQLIHEEKSVTTVKHNHAVIHGALEYAIGRKLRKANPSSRIGFPSQKAFKGDYY